MRHHVTVSACCLLLSAAPLAAAPIVISQFYGGGGNVGATLTHDYVELFNPGTTVVSLDGWSLQYTSATGPALFGANTVQITNLPSVLLAPGAYLLIQQFQGAGGSTSLPTPDVIDSTGITIDQSQGKIALVDMASPLGCNGGSAPCDAAAVAHIVDLVGYGGADFFEGSGAAPILSNTLAAFRINGGCTDNDNNAADFVVGAPAPRNSASPPHLCTNVPEVPEPTSMALVLSGVAAIWARARRRGAS